MSLFRSSPKSTYTDRVWKTKSACCKGLATEALRSLTEGQVVVVYFFFSSDQKQFVQFLDANKAPYFLMDSGTVADARSQDKSIFILDALSPSSGADDFLRERSKVSAMRIIFFGHYPLLKPENEVLDKIRQLSSAKSFLFCLSLEDGLFESFGSARIAPLMETLGIGDDEFIEHAMVSKALLNAREKLSGLVVNEMKERKESEWFKRNGPAKLV